MKKPRPVFLNLFKIKFPPAAIASILHRISGVILFLAVPLILWLLSRSLNSSDSYHKLLSFIANPWMKLLLWIIIGGFIYHLIAGVRHLLMDAHLGEAKTTGNVTAISAIVLSAILIILAGVWLWLL